MRTRTAIFEDSDLWLDDGDHKAALGKPVVPAFVPAFVPAVVPAVAPAVALLCTRSQRVQSAASSDSDSDSTRRRY